MVHTTIKLGGTASDVVVAKVAHGLMMMTWKPTPVPDDQCFEAIKAGIDSLPAGVKMFVNSGEFYGAGFSTANLELLSRFLEKYPEYADRIFLSVKGGAQIPALKPDSSMENLRRSLGNINAALRGTKKVDLFESARVDPDTPIEQAVQNMVVLLKEGHFNHLGMSECSAATLKRANAVYPVTAVEIEVSPWSYEDETKKVITTAKELGISVVAYSPLGRGFLAGKIKSKEDFEEGDFRRSMTRFQDENVQHNIRLVQALEEIAQKKGISKAQLCIAWVSSLGPHVVPLPGSSHAQRTLENLAAADITLSEEEIQAISMAIADVSVKGDRYWGQDPKAAHLWG